MLRMSDPKAERILFVTGRLAEPSVRKIIAELAEEQGFDFDVAVLPISVAALMHVGWVQRKLEIEQHFDRVILPGWCQGDLASLNEHFGTRFELGPKNVFDLPHFWNRKSSPPDLSQYSVEIIAEINHAPAMSREELIEVAGHYGESGADIIDLGCIPGYCWSDVADAVSELKDLGFRISIDSFSRDEVEPAVTAGAELVLSCNGTNVEWAQELDAEFVVIPDDVKNLDTLENTIEQMSASRSRFRIDPILEPIGFGFAASLGRYLEARRRWPELDMMMGIGNVTELVEVDSAAANMLLAGFCQEVKIGSVLTTEVINWAQSSVREFDLARRLSEYSEKNRTLPKHVDSQLVMLRDPKTHRPASDAIAEIAADVRDPNYRIMNDDAGMMHLFNRDGQWSGENPYQLFAAALEANPRGIEASHAFYLGFEMCKAMTALTLGKQYTQDEALSWGFLGRPDPGKWTKQRAERQHESSKNDTGDKERA